MSTSELASRVYRALAAYGDTPSRDQWHPCGRHSRRAFMQERIGHAASSISLDQLSSSAVLVNQKPLSLPFTATLVPYLHHIRVFSCKKEATMPVIRQALPPMPSARGLPDELRCHWPESILPASRKRAFKPTVKANTTWHPTRRGAGVGVGSPLLRASHVLGTRR